MLLASPVSRDQLVFDTSKATDSVIFADLYCTHVALKQNCSQNMIDAMCHHPHPNLIECIGWIQESKNCFTLVMEYMNQGSLYDALLQSPSLSVLDRLYIALDVCRAMAYLHSNGNPIAHGALDLQNILLRNCNVAKLTNCLWLTNATDVQVQDDVKQFGSILSALFLDSNVPTKVQMLIARLIDACDNNTISFQTMIQIFDHAIDSNSR